MTIGSHSDGAASRARRLPSKTEMFTKLCLSWFYPIQACWVSFLPAELAICVTSLMLLPAKLCTQHPSCCLHEILIISV